MKEHSPLIEFLKKTPAYSHWKKIGIHSHHGIALPISSLHSEHSSGIGEFTDLVPLIDWLVSVDMNILQILPVNDSGWETSPYNALSAFALHPIFIGLSQLPFIQNDESLQMLLKDLQLLNLLPKVAYREVLKKKLHFLQIYFQSYSREFISTHSYKQFCKQEEDWLKPYALFKSLKDRFLQKSWLKWPKQYQSLSKKDLHLLYKKYAIPMEFYTFLQFLCAKQLQAVKDHAKKQGVFFVGDVPILFSTDSVDPWLYPSLFNFIYTVGAPPDEFNPAGQCWGFPSYNWKKHKESILILWKKRLTFAEKLYHLYRIDHVIGFYRIWKIPRGKSAVHGFFFPKETNLALSQGEEILQFFLSATSMLPLAEDLGAITTFIKNSLMRLGIPGIRVMRWEKTKEHLYLSVHRYSPLSATMVSTHDSETLTLWWSQCKKEAKAYAKQKRWKYLCALSVTKRYKILKEAHSSPSLFHINLIQEYLAFFPELSWENPEEERINIPGKILATNWVYRIKPSLEELITHQPLLTLIKELIGR